MTLLTVWIGLFLLSAAWAFATPLGASPDEPAHVIKAAAVVRGQLLGATGNGAAERVVEVPKGIGNAHAWPCYAFKPQLPASCLSNIPGGAEIVPAPTTAGLYNPTYYALVGWPSLIAPADPAVSTYGMRLLGALIASGFLSAGFAALSRLRIGRFTALAFTAAVTPMVVFLSGSVNPNAFEISTAFALISSLFLLVARTPRLRRWPWLVLAGVSGVLLAQARGLSPFWILLIALIVCVTTPTPRLLRELRRWPTLVTIGATGLGAAGAVGWTLMTGTLGSMGNFPGAQDTPIRAFVNMIIDAAINPGLIGVFGWLDTPAPSLVFLTWSFLALATVLISLATADGRGVVALIIALSGVLIVPAAAQAVSVGSSGYIWQGRYAIVAYVCLMATAVAAVKVNEHRSQWLDRATGVLVVVTVTAHISAFTGALTRYQGGGSIIDLFVRPEWSPPGGVTLWVGVALLGASITTVAAMFDSLERAETKFAPGRVHEAAQQ